MALWVTGDILKTRDIFTDSCTYEDVANNKTLFKQITGRAL